MQPWALASASAIEARDGHGGGRVEASGWRRFDFGDAIFNFLRREAEDEA